jgi:hypothetical protein
MMEEMGKNISDSMVYAMRLRMQQKEIDLQSMQKVKDFMSLPPDKRKALLLNPDFRSQMIQTLDPDAFSTKKKAKKTSSDTAGMQQREASAMMLGEPSAEEQVKQQTLVEQGKKAEAEAAIATRKKELSTGERSITAMDLFATFDFKDPLAATLAESVMSNPETKQMVLNAALAEKKAGPLYAKQQQQEWFKWGTEQGLPLGIAIESAIHIAAGEWDKVPTTYTDMKTGKVIPIRAKAEQELLFQSINAVSRQQEVQNSIENSIATSSVQFAEKTGLPLDQSRANILALRQGKPIPYPTTHLEDMAKLEEINKRVEIDKISQTIINDKHNMIRESLNSMISAYKDYGTGGIGGGAATKDLEDKIEQTMQEMTKSLASKYGIKYKAYDELHWVFGPAVNRAFKQTWEGMKAAGALPVDLGADGIKKFEQLIVPQIGEAPGESKPTTVTPFIPGGLLTTPKGVKKKASFSPEQEKVFRSLHESVQTALSSQSLTPAQRDNLQKFVDERLNPVYEDPSRFNELLLSPSLTGIQ